MTLYSEGILQAAATIAKTTETVMKGEIGCDGYNTLTLFVDYVNGDETGVVIYPYFLAVSGGTEYPEQDWTSAVGERTILTRNTYKLTASDSVMLTFDISGKTFIKFYQGGAINDGTPTGTIAARYTMTDGS